MLLFLLQRCLELLSGHILHAQRRHTEAQRLRTLDGREQDEQFPIAGGKQTHRYCLLYGASRVVTLQERTGYASEADTQELYCRTDQVLSECGDAFAGGTSPD